MEIFRHPDVVGPRPVGASMAYRLESEENEVSVSHVLILSAEEKPRHDTTLRVTEHDHCVTKITHRIIAQVR